VKTLTIREARDQMARIEQILAREGEVLLTRRGQPIARILPLTGGRAIPSRAALRRQMTRVKRPSEEIVRDDREGR
jgi:antitoxin (DNA-binding transcriptional repressor) of toxin-antitoxin stability system